MSDAPKPLTEEELEELGDYFDTEEDPRLRQNSLGLVVEVRRLRALAGTIVDTLWGGYGTAFPPTDAYWQCRFCGAKVVGNAAAKEAAEPHRAGCAWPDIVALSSAKRREAKP